jgi:hypothetical protein
VIPFSLFAAIPLPRALTGRHCMARTQNFRHTHDRLRARGKLYKVALVATMRKLLLILNAIIKTDTPWSESCLVNA